MPRGEEITITDADNGRRYEIFIVNEFGTTVSIKVSKNLITTLNDGVKAGKIDELLDDEVKDVTLT